jgi:hypothetical protein
VGEAILLVLWTHLLTAILQDQGLDVSSADWTAGLLARAHPLLYTATAELVTTALHCCWLLHAAHADVALMFMVVFISLA